MLPFFDLPKRDGIHEFDPNKIAVVQRSNDGLIPQGKVAMVFDQCERYTDLPDIFHINCCFRPTFRALWPAERRTRTASGLVFAASLLRSIIPDRINTPNVDGQQIKGCAKAAKFRRIFEKGYSCTTRARHCPCFCVARMHQEQGRLVGMMTGTKRNVITCWFAVVHGNRVALTHVGRRRTIFAQVECVHYCLNDPGITLAELCLRDVRIIAVRVWKYLI